MTEVLMPKATAVWLIDNTSLTFDQIAELCGLHVLEVKGIADGDVAAGVRGADPIANGQLTRDEIERAEADADYRMVLVKGKHADMLDKGAKKGPRYTPLSKRQERPNAIAWLVRHHPELTDGQISKLIGTTKTTIEAVRTREHWNRDNIQPQDPVALGLCKQIELDEAVRKAADRRRKELGDAAPPEGEPLRPIEETLAAEEAEAAEETAHGRGGSLSADDVFARFSDKAEGEGDGAGGTDDAPASEDEEEDDAPAR